MEKKLLTYTIAASFLLIGLDIIGYFFPISLTWGFHFLGFLPPYIFVLYLILSASVFLFHFNGDLERAFRSGTAFMEKKPAAFLTVVILIFIAFAFVFRVKASVLGDSFTMIYNFRDCAAGISYLAPWHEPFSMYVLYYATTLLGSLNYPQIFTSFFIIEIFFGIGFILVTFYCVKKLFASTLQQFSVFMFLLVLPYMEFYFGYIEVYSVSILLFMVFILVSVLILQAKLPFYYLPTTWLLLTLSHYINGLLAPAVLYIAYLEYKQQKIKNLAIGFGSALFIAVVILIAAGFDVERLINISPVSHFLSLTNYISDINAYSQAYTLFSFYHLAEIVNYIIFMCPFAVLIIIFWAVEYKQESFIANPLNMWFIITIAPVFLYYLVSKLEQGNASDWDAFAGQFILIALFAAVIFFQRENEYSAKIFSLIVCVSLLQSLPWFAVNAPVQPSIQRFQSLWDRRMLSHLGNYTHALRLTRYYDSQNDSLSQTDVWEHYSSVHPEDPRGYINELQLLNRFTPDDYERKIAAYVRWIMIDPENDSLRYALSGVYINAGNMFFSNNKLDEARVCYLNSITVDSTASKAFNNLGSVYAQEGKLDTAIIFYTKAISLDSLYTEAYYNLGNVNLDQHNLKKGIEFIKRAARLGNPQAQEFLKRRGEEW